MPLDTQAVYAPPARRSSGEPVVRRTAAETSSVRARKPSFAYTRTR